MDTVPPSALKTRERPPGMPPLIPQRSTLRLVLRYLLPGAIVLLLLVAGVAGYLQQWLWMGQLHYTGIFWTLFTVQWTMYAACFAVVFLFIWINLRQALRNGGVPSGRGTMPRALLPPPGDDLQLGQELTPHLLHSAIVVVSLGLAWLAASTFFSQWDTWLRFRYGGTFGVADPLYGIDVGFYVFQLPFYQMLQNSVTLLIMPTLAGVGVIYAYFKAVSLSRSKNTWQDGTATSHLSVLLLILVANFGIGLLLNHYQLVYSTMGVVYGAGYTAAHLTRIALWCMVALSIVACVLLGVNDFRRRLRPLHRQSPSKLCPPEYRGYDSVWKSLSHRGPLP